MRTRARAIAVALVLAGCDEPLPDIDPFPILVDLSAGATLAKADTGVGVVPAVIDTLAPLSVVDTHVDGDPLTGPTRRRVDWTIVSGDSTNTPRVRFEGANVVDIRPCADPDAPCMVGLDTDARPYRAILGADVIGRVAMRFEPGASSIRLFPDIAGDDDEHGAACEAVLPRSFGGGGRVAIAGGEVRYEGRRATMRACLEPSAQFVDTATGADMLLVVATGVGPMVLGRRAYERYRRSVIGAFAEYESLPVATLHLTSGPVPVRLASIRRLAIVGDTPGDTARSPCAELRTSRITSNGGCGDDIIDCPCSDRRFCAAAASATIESPLVIAVIADEHPLLQALREELRPELADVDGLIGTAALRAMRVDLDYPNDRVLLDCVDHDRCTITPALGSPSRIAGASACASRAAEQTE